MEKIMNLGKLRIEPVVASGRGVTVGKTPQFVCVKCQTTFPLYKGMTRRGPGLGYCPSHNPKDTKK